MPSFRVAVYTRGDSRPSYNTVRLATRAEIEAYAKDIPYQWLMVERVEIEPSADPVNLQYVAGELKAVTNSGT